jgi:acetyl esterase/lipase
MVLLCSTAQAQTTSTWQPSPGHTQIPIWPGTPPDAQLPAGPETATTQQNKLIAGRPYLSVSDVSVPTMTVYSPKDKNTGLAVVVFPGGGYHILAIDLEGTEVCDWLASNGITGVLLKYRVPGGGPDPKTGVHISGAYPDNRMALDDAQRTLGLVRSRAAEWHIDPHRIGVLGFSAGGHLVAATSTHFDKRLYPAIDAADQTSCRPDFAVALYPGHMSEHTSEPWELNPYVPVTANTPPTFLLMNEDDHVDGVDNALIYYMALKKAGVPVEMHLYAQGGHGFGLRQTELPATRWPALIETWLRTIGMISQ